MGIHNSRFSELIADLYSNLYLDVAEQVGVDAVESKHDLSKICSRHAAEGLPFYTVTLPRLAKAVDTALTSGCLEAPLGFQKKPGTDLPKLFGSIFSQVFDDSGLLKPDASIPAVRALRQLGYYLYKLEIDVDPKLAQKVIDGFVEVDRELDTLDIPDDNTTDVARMITTSVFGTFCPRDIIPRHGPGSVATGERAHEKHVFKRIYSDLEQMYPFTEYFEFSLAAVSDSFHRYEDLELLRSGTAKVVLVPKDSRGPRIISCEPVEYMWIQQGLGTKVQRHIQSHRITSGLVNFDDQTINRRLALDSSMTQDWVTLDMKEASDRVSLKLVERLFSDCPNLLAALCATRSKATQLPNGMVMPLNKFAPMGSALCFPVESFVFWVLAVSAIMCKYNLPRRKARKMVFAYGDDLIVRSEVYGAVLETLPKYGLMFNEGKCCTAGFFRESCGCDAFKGVDVTPLRLKAVWNHRRVEASSICSYVAHSNAAWEHKYYRLANTVQELVDQRFRKERWPMMPYSDREIGVLSWVGRPVPLHMQPKGVKSRAIMNRKDHGKPNYQRPEVYGAYPASQRITADPDNWSTILRRISSSPEGAKPGLYAVPHRSNLQWGWTPVA